MKKLFLLTALLCLAVEQTLFAGEIAFSFDDAPTQFRGHFSNDQRTSALLDALKRANIEQAAFFAVSKRVDKVGKSRLHRYAKAGHLIANHTHDHPNLHKIGAEAFIENIEQAHSQLSTLPNFTAWFRFPYLNSGKTVAQRNAVRLWLENNGYRHGYVTVDNYDWYMDKLLRDATTAGKTIHFEKLKQLYIDVLWQAILFYDDMAKAVTKRSPKHVLLLHENDSAALFVADLAKHIRSHGWTIIPIEKAYQDPIAEADPDIALGQGIITRIAKASDYKGRLSHDAESERYLDELFKKSDVFSPSSQNPVVKADRVIK